MPFEKEASLAISSSYILAFIILQWLWPVIEVKINLPWKYVGIYIQRAACYNSSVYL